MMDWLISPAFAQDGGAAAGGSPMGSLLTMMALMFGIFYFLVIRPQNKEMQKHKAMLDALKKGDRVVTTGGVHGRVHSLREGTVSIEVADKVRITVNRANIAGRADTEEAK